MRLSDLLGPRSSTRRAVAARPGYERRRMKGPLPVKLLFGWLYHHGRYVDGERVRRVEPDRILIAGSAADLPPPGTVGLAHTMPFDRHLEGGR